MLQQDTLCRWAPPGFPIKRELGWYAAFLTGSVFCSLLLFTVRFQDAYYRLFFISGDVKVVNPEQQMADFADLTEHTYVCFFITLLYMLGYIFIHYRYHYQGAMSIYLMKRLPDKGELHRRCLTVPLAAMAATLLTAAVLTGLYWMVYMNLTPDQCLVPGQAEKFWRGFL